MDHAVMQIARLAADEALAALGSGRDGLSAAEAARRLGEFGANKVAALSRPSPWLVLLGEFTHFFALLLWFAAALAFVAAALEPGQGMFELGLAIVVVVLSALAGYSLSRLDFLGRRGFMSLTLILHAFPSVTLLIAIYFVLRALQLYNTIQGVILVKVALELPLGMWLMKGFFDNVPWDIERAAMVDGASRFGAFVRVVLPAVRPALAVTALFSFMSAWNEFILAATFLSTERNYTLPMVLQSYAGEHDANLGHFAAGAIVVSVPVMALFYVLQRQLVSGLTSGGVKG